MRKRSKIKAVFFDIDDTLFDSTTLAKMARINAVKAMIEAGLPLTSVTQGYNILMKIVDKYGSNYDKHFDKLLENLGCDWSPRIIAAGVIAYHDTKQAFLKPEPKVIPTLIALRGRGYKLGIISNGKSVKQWEKIIRLGLHHFFDAVVISEDVGSEKPNSRIFEVAMEKLNVKPWEAVYVGDDLETDILGANSAGMVSIRIIRKKHREGSPSGKVIKPKYSIRKFSDLLSILEKLDDEPLVSG
jgi:putative hydrolase of the HAD superfamily